MRICQADWNHWPDAPSPAESDPRCWTACARLGVDAIEVGVYDTAAELAPERETARDVLAGEHSVPVGALLLSLPAQHWPGGALSGDEPDRLVSQVDGCAAAAARRGITTLGVWPGADPAHASWPQCAHVLARCRDAAAVHGVRIAVEYKPATVVSDVDAARRMAAEVPGTGVLVDTGHSWAAFEDPAEAVRALADDGVLWQVHLGDAHPGDADDDLPLGAVHSPGPLLAALREVGYTGTAAFDLYGATSSADWTGETALQASLAALRGAAR